MKALAQTVAAAAVSFALVGCSGGGDETAAASELSTTVLPVEQRAQLESYDPAADPFEQYESAVAKAESEGKQVMLVFGADWCPDCRILSAEFQSEPLATLIDERYVVEKIHVGRKDANTEFTEQWGDPAANGIPSIVVMNTDGSLVTRTDAGELSIIRKLSPAEVYAWFDGLPRG